MKKSKSALIAALVALPAFALSAWLAGAVFASDADPGEKSESKKQPADNSSCYVCHADYEEERLAQIHVKEGIGCVDCHGQSQDHADDEDHFTPPDVMYPLAKIDKSCEECHDAHDVPATNVLRRWQERCPEKTKASDIVCTDCHGRHRLAKRKVRWNKTTGEMLDDE